MTGRIHAFQSLGAVDGPGLRCVVFLQGCPLRCRYCHNPDTWNDQGGEEVELEALVQRILRFRPYFGSTGGVTVSGGEPLRQAAFVSALFEALHAHGIHTALDTAGVGTLEEAKQVLAHTDLVICDLKSSTEEGYRALCGGSLKQTEWFLQLTVQLDIPLWIRHVVVPNLTDAPAHLQRISAYAHTLPNLEKLEWLPFHNLCIEKYQALGIPFPLHDTLPLSDEQLQHLLARAGLV